MRQHILRLHRNVLTLWANRQTGVDGYNARTISRPIKTIKTDRDFERNCPTHFLHTHMPRKCVRMCNAQSQLGQFGSRTHRNCCCPQANLTGNTLPDYNTATHSHTKSFSHIHNTQNSTSTPHKYKLRLMPSNTLWGHGKVIFLSDSFRNFHLHRLKTYTLCKYK